MKSVLIRVIRGQILFLIAVSLRYGLIELFFSDNWSQDLTTK
jgi:hypothetical protein